MEEKRSKSKDSLSGASTDMRGNAGGSSKSAEKVEERLRKLYASRLEAEKKIAARTALERVKRALKIASKKHAINDEESPLKVKMLDSLTVSRPVGKTAAGEDLEFEGLNEDLALHLVEAAWEEAADAEIDRLIERAAEILNYDDQYLVSAERDLARRASVVPTLIAAEQLQAQSEVQHRAASLRGELSRGNLELAPSIPEAEAPGMTKAASIRAALGTSRVGRTLQDAFAPEQTN
jgi:hypothetical protein